MRKFDIYDAIQQTMFIQDCSWEKACNLMTLFITENPTYCTQLDCHTQRTAKDILVHA